MGGSPPRHVPCPRGLRRSDLGEEVDGTRSCAPCDRRIFDFSLVTAAQAAEVKRLHGGAVCATVPRDAAGYPIYALTPLRRIVRTAAGVVLSASLAACAAEPSSDPPPIAPAREPAALADPPREEEELLPAEPPAPALDDPPEALVEHGTLEQATPEPTPRPVRRHPRRRPIDDDPIAGLDGL